MREFLGGPEVSENFRNASRKSAEVESWRDGFGILLREENRMIGLASFNGPPDADGMVEISYAVASGYTGRGYATAAARLLIAQALASGAVRTVRAHTAPAENASTRILRKVRFQMKGAIMDPEDGLIWRWALPIS